MHNSSICRASFDNIVRFVSFSFFKALCVQPLHVQILLVRVFFTGYPAAPWVFKDLPRHEDPESTFGSHSACLQSWGCHHLPTQLCLCKSGSTCRHCEGHVFYFSSAFNTFGSTLQGDKLTARQVDASFVSWIVDHLTGRPQYVRLQYCV